MPLGQSYIRSRALGVGPEGMHTYAWALHPGHTDIGLKGYIQDKSYLDVGRTISLYVLQSALEW